MRKPEMKARFGFMSAAFFTAPFRGVVSSVPAAGDVVGRE
jgi:hypothetical protein